MHFAQGIPLILDSASLSNTFHLTSYHALSENVVGALKFQARSIHGLNDENVRLSKRLYIPKKRLRGFEVLKTGPKVSLSPSSFGVNADGIFIANTG